jgi:hypothetical protein
MSRNALGSSSEDYQKVIQGLDRKDLDKHYASGLISKDIYKGEISRRWWRNVKIAGGIGGGLAGIGGLLYGMFNGKDEE